MSLEDLLCAMPYAGQGTLDHLTIVLGGRGTGATFQKGKPRHREVKSLAGGRSLRMWQRGRGGAALSSRESEAQPIVQMEKLRAWTQTWTQICLTPRALFSA